MPRMVPGTYFYHRYGKKISNFTAYDNNNNRLRTMRKNRNDYLIFNAENIDRIEYLVAATWHTRSTIDRCAGTNIEPQRNFVINHSGFYGYFKGYKNRKYTLKYIKPENLIAATALKNISKNDTLEIYTAENYFTLVDNPLMFHSGDTISHIIETTKYHIALQSDNNSISVDSLN